LLRRIEKIIRNHGLLSRGGRCLVAVSGGPDSMALMRVLAALRPRLGFTLAAAHVDHGLRPGEDEAELALVQKEAAALGLACECGRLDAGGHARAQGLSVEHAARDLRHAFLAEAAERQQADKIALAHTADDQAEEVLLRLIRGTGRKGLAGMALRSGRLIRPFLTTEKREILRYLAIKGIPYLMDSSNLKPVYLRNRIRLELLPYLRENFNPAIDQGLRQTASVLAAEEELLAGLCGEAESRCLMVVPPEGALAVSLKEFRREPLAIKRRLLEAACWRMACRPSFRQLAQLLHLAEHGETGARLHLAMGLRAVREKDRLVLGYPAGRKAYRGDAEEM